MKPKTLGWLHMGVAFTTALWAGLLVAGGTVPVTTLAEKIASLEGMGADYTVIYANAAAITLLSMALFCGLYLEVRAAAPLWALVGLMMVPLYGMGNLVAYLSQIWIVPQLLTVYHQPDTAATAELLLSLTLQDWPGSAMAALNSLSYALLGIPSVVFGVLLARRKRETRMGGAVLALSGLMSLAAFVGVVLANPTLRALTVVGGLLYLIGVLLLGIYFLRRPPMARLP